MTVLDVLKSAVGADVLVTSLVFSHVLELQLEPGTAFPEEEETKVQSAPLTQSSAPCSLAFAHSEAVKKLWKRQTNFYEINGKATVNMHKQNVIVT